MKKILLFGCILIISCFSGCTSTDITYTQEENNNIKMYVQYANCYIEADFAKYTVAPRCFVEPYRCRYRLVKSTLK